MRRTSITTRRGIFARKSDIGSHLGEGPGKYTPNCNRTGGARASRRAPLCPDGASTTNIIRRRPVTTTTRHHKPFVGNNKARLLRRCSDKGGLRVQRIKSGRACNNIKKRRATCKASCACTLIWARGRPRRPIRALRQGPAPPWAGIWVAHHCCRGALMRKGLRTDAHAYHKGGS